MSEKERNDELRATITRKIAQVEEQEDILCREERKQMEQLASTVQELKREEARYTDIFQQLHSLGDEDAQKTSSLLQAVTRDVRNSCQSHQQVKSRQSTFGSVSGWQTTFRSCLYRWQRTF